MRESNGATSYLTQNFENVVEHYRIRLPGFKVEEGIAIYICAYQIVE
jgi:hypothetical protein